MDLIEKFGLSKATSIPVSTAKECCKLFWEWMNSAEGHPEHYPEEEVIRFGMRLRARSKTEGRTFRVLDLGSGSGKNSFFLAECGFDLYCVDWSAPGLDYMSSILRSRNLQAKTQCVDYTENPLPYQDNFFDGIVAIQTFDHLIDSDAKKVRDEAARVLAPRGQMICSLMTTKTSKPSRTGVPLEGEKYTQLVSTGNSAGEIHRFFEPPLMTQFLEEKFTIKSHLTITASDAMKNEVAEAGYFVVEKK